MNHEDLFWNASINELKKGYVFDKTNECLTCIICGKEYMPGIIYSVNNQLVDSKLAMRSHIKEKHVSTFHYLNNLQKKHSGLSDVQKNITLGMYEGLSDKDISQKMNNKALSTIRNHRFVLREKYKESKIFIAIMDLIQENDKMNKIDEFIHFHKNIPVDDDRTVITESENKLILNKYFTDNFATLKKFPKKQKEKLVILKQITKMFNNERKYTEKEVNSILENLYEDYITLRRYLIDYQFLDRKADGSLYWIKK